MPRFAVLAVAILGSTGCTSVKLHQSVTSQATTVMDLYYQQVLNNLAQFSVNPYALPSHVQIKEGSAQIQDFGQLSVLGQFGQLTGRLAAGSPALTGSRTVVEQWGVEPVTDDIETRVLRIAYQRAMGLPVLMDVDLVNDLARELARQTAESSDLDLKNAELVAITYREESVRRMAWASGFNQMPGAPPTFPGGPSGQPFPLQYQPAPGLSPNPGALPTSPGGPLGQPPFQNQPAPGLPPNPGALPTSPGGPLGQPFPFQLGQPFPFQNQPTPEPNQYTFLFWFDLRLMSWGDGSGVPTSGKSLVVVGTDDKGLLHIRIFDFAGRRITDADEWQLPAQAAAIATLKQQLPGLLPPHVLTDAEKNKVVGEATSIAGQTLLFFPIIREDILRERRRTDKIKFLDEALSTIYLDIIVSRISITTNSDNIISKQEFDADPTLASMRPESRLFLEDELEYDFLRPILRVALYRGLAPDEIPTIFATPLAKSARREVKDTQNDLIHITPGWFHTGRKCDLPKNACYVGRYKDRYAWVCEDGLPGLSQFTNDVMRFSDLIKERTVLTVPGGPRFTPSAGR
jgi:hypothetical protein